MLHVSARLWLSLSSPNSPTSPSDVARSKIKVYQQISKEVGELKSACVWPEFILRDGPRWWEGEVVLTKELFSLHLWEIAHEF